MILRKRLKNPKTMMLIGMVCLLLANLSHWFLHPTTNFRQGLVDGMTGMLFGISFGMNLWAVRLKCRQRRCGVC